MNVTVPMFVCYNCLLHCNVNDVKRCWNSRTTKKSRKTSRGDGINNHPKVIFFYVAMYNEKICMRGSIVNYFLDSRMNTLFKSEIRTIGENSWKLWKSMQCGGPLLGVKCCCFMQNCHEGFTENWAVACSERGKKRKKKLCSFLQVHCSVPSLWFLELVPQGVFWVMKKFYDSI